jgi:hypothetical protein
MGWYYRNGGTRKELISELTESGKIATDQGSELITNCLASCYRGGVFSGVLWGVWERNVLKDSQQVEPTHRWVTCDILQCQKGDWGHKPLSESMHPYFYSCPLGYLKMVPIEIYGGNEEWRELVHRNHNEQADKRRQRRLQVAI